MAVAFLILSVVIFAVLLLALMLMLLIYYSHPDDKNEAYLPKVVVVIALWLAFGSMLILPFDVSVAKDGVPSSIRVDVLWQLIFMVDAVMIVVVIPFAFFFYEADMDRGQQTCCNNQLCNAAKWTGGFFCGFSTLLLILFFVTGDARIPVQRYAHSTNLIVPAASTFTLVASEVVKGSFIWEIPVTFPVYTMAFLGFVGWWFFVMFVGVGLVSLPLDLINEFRTRPEPMKFTEYAAKKKELGRRAGHLISAGSKLAKSMNSTQKKTRKERRMDQQTYTKFETAYYFLKRDYELLQTSYRLKGGNPLWYVMKLFFGIICGILSITWLVHMGVFMLPDEPSHPMLNQFFIELELAGGGDFPLFGVVAFGLYGFYLLWCCVKGNFKLGVRITFWKVYPMELNNTLMNSFLFNAGLILLMSIPALQFCVMAFPVYARFTTIDMIFGTQGQHLKGFRELWKNDVFEYMILIFAFLTIVWHCFRPRDRTKDIERQLDQIAKRDVEDMQATAT